MQHVMIVLLALGAWTAEFNEDAQLLTLIHNETRVKICGKLAFESNEPGWKFAAPRDGAKERLALLDPSGNAQGYLTLRADGDRLEALLYHRTRQFYEGRATFVADVLFRDESFACRTRPDLGERVLTLANGPADSANFDALFAREEDLALRFDAPNLHLRAVANVETPARDVYLDGAQYVATFSGRIEEAAEAKFAIEVDRRYFQTRWAPYYAPIDRARCPKPPTGWMSWNVYFDKATAEDNLAEARVAKEKFQPFGLEIISIESWQGNSDQLPVSKFYNLNLETNEKQFPKGMKDLAQEIRKLGFKPGLWTAPFGTGSDEFYQAHKDWFLHAPDGAPMATWNGKYTIDPSNDEVLDHIRRIHEIASKDWGYEFFKIDGMSGAGPGYCAHFFERPEVRAAFKNPDVEAPFERCVKALREGIGDDRIFLACQGHFTGPEARYADAARTGADVVHPNQPVKWENVMRQAGRTLNQIFVNNIIFYTDPDTLLVRDLPTEEARVAATLVALTGQQTFFGDFLAKLSDDQTRLLQQTLPVCDVRPGALYPYFKNLPVWDLKVAKPFANWDVVALFNWDDEEKEIPVSIEELGLAPGEYVAYECWTKTLLGASSNGFSVRAPGRSVRLVTIARAQATPQFLASDRHVTQGAIDLIDCRWNANERALDVSLELVANHATTARFLIPTDYRFVGVDAEGATVDARLEASERVVAVSATSAETRAVKLTLRFEPR